MYLRLFIFICFSTAFLFACRSTKTIQRAITKKDTTTVVVTKPEATRTDTLRIIDSLTDSIRLRQIDFSTFSARAKVTYANQNGKQPDFLAFIRIRKDSIIWLSLANDLGIEGIRILVTPDSIKVMDKLAKTIQVRPLSKLQEISQIPFSFFDLQHILVGRPIFFHEDSVLHYASGPDEYQLFSKMGDIKNNLTVNKQYYPEKSRIDDAMASLGRRADLLYKEYEDKNGLLFSTLREIFISHKEVFNVQMKFKDYHFNELLSFPFNIPKKFKKIP
jgi:hypothetical protein